MNVTQGMVGGGEGLTINSNYFSHNRKEVNLQWEIVKKKMKKEQREDDPETMCTSFSPNSREQ